MPVRFTIVGIGEGLFDVLPKGDVLGGAPLNVAVHAHQLASSHDGAGVVATRVGQDARGRTLQKHLRQRGMTTAYVQEDPDLPTGVVYVAVDGAGQPTYDIVEQVAWDVLQFDPDFESLARRCQAVCFGTLAQRHSQARQTIRRFTTMAPQAVCMFDVNLRQHYFDRQIIEDSLQRCNVLKLNDEELPVLAEMFHLPAASADASTDDSGDAGEDVKADGIADARMFSLMKKFDLQAAMLTRGAKGCVLYADGSRFEDQPVTYPAAENADAVGAGDACAAAVLVGLCLRIPHAKLTAIANHAGAYVASQPGATPALPDEILAMYDRS